LASGMAYPSAEGGVANGRYWASLFQSTIVLVTGDKRG
jgi:hypothetical protein